MMSCLKKTLLFFFPLLLIFVLLNAWLDRESSPHYALQYREVFHPKVNANIIILGASAATHGVNPKYLENNHLKVFNFSLNGAGPSLNLKWYQKIFQLHYPKPLGVIYGVHWGMFDGKMAHRQFEQDSQYFPPEFFYREFSHLKGYRDLETLKTLILNRIPLVRERKQLVKRLFGKTKDVFILEKYYNGYIPYERRGGLNKRKDFRPRNQEAQIRDFEALLDEFKRDNIEVIFVQVPGYFPARTASNIEEAMELIDRIARKRNIPFLDYDTRRVTDINTDPSMFSDWLHLNEKGSHAFSDRLKSDLEPFLGRIVANKEKPST